MVEILTCTPDLLARFAWQIALASEASARQVHVSPLRGSHRPDVLRENDMLGLSDTLYIKPLGDQDLNKNFNKDFKEEE